METFVSAMRLFIVTTVILVGSTSYFASYETDGRRHDGGEIVVRRRLSWRGRKFITPPPEGAKNAKATVNHVFMVMALAWLGSASVYAAVLWTALTGLLQLVFEIWPLILMLVIMVAVLWLAHQTGFFSAKFDVAERNEPRTLNQQLLDERVAERMRQEKLARAQAAREEADDAVLRERRLARDAMIDPEASRS